jgi:hypothetical protein
METDMQMHNRRDLCPSRDEVAELSEHYDESLPPPKYQLPREVIDDLIQTRNYLYRLAERIGEDYYDGEGSRDGVAMDCDCFGEKLHYLLEDCGHGLERYPSWWPDECKR